MAIRVEIERGLACWASYLVNDDSSGLSDEELKEADNFLESISPGYVVSTEGDEYFSWAPAGTCVDYIIHYPE